MTRGEKMKKLLFVIVAVLALTTLIGSTVSAAPKTGTGNMQVPFYPCGPGQSNDVLTNEPAQGKVILNTPDGHVTLNITGIVSGLLPSTEYRVWVREIDAYAGDYMYYAAGWHGYELLAFTTEADGTGSFHLNIRAADLPAGGYDIQVAINPAAEWISHTVLATVMFTAITVGQ
jgi:hypothetical protein